MYRITDPARSRAFYEALGLEFRRELPIVRNGELEATNYFFAAPGQDEELELTFNHDGRSYEMGTAYGHIALGVDDLDATLSQLAEQGIEPEREPYRVREGGSRLCFVRDPDEYRIELIERGRSSGGLLVLLYDSPVSGNCYKVRLLSAHLGLPYERRTLDVVDRSNRPELLGGLNPALRVPTLDPRRRQPARGVGRDPLVFRRGDAFRTRPTGTSGRRCCSGCSSSSTTTSRRSRSSASGLAYSGRPDAFADRLEERTAAGYRALDAMERHLAGREFVVGAAPTLADIALYAYTHVAYEGGFELARYPAIEEWLGRVAAMPGHVPIDA